jgi:hypothetical protein
VFGQLWHATTVAGGTIAVMGSMTRWAVIVVCATSALAVGCTDDSEWGQQRTTTTDAPEPAAAAEVPSERAAACSELATTVIDVFQAADAADVPEPLARLDALASSGAFDESASTYLSEFHDDLELVLDETTSGGELSEEGATAMASFQQRALQATAFTDAGCDGSPADLDVSAQVVPSTGTDPATPAP